MKFGDKLAFIKNDDIKDKFIETIKQRQYDIDQMEKQKFCEHLKIFAENYIMKRREKLKLTEYTDMKNIYRDRSNKYSDILTAIENALEKDIIYYNTRNASTDFNLVDVKEKIKKVEQRLKYLNKRKHQKQFLMIQETNRKNKAEKLIKSKMKAHLSESMKNIELEKSPLRSEKL